MLNDFKKDTSCPASVRGCPWRFPPGLVRPAPARDVRVVSLARSFLGTPYKHQGRVPGLNGGLDCVGVPIVINWQLGTTDYNIDNYPPEPNGLLMTEIQKVCRPLPFILTGALLVFEFKSEPRHCAIASRFRNHWGIIHAYQNAGYVKEHELNSWWDKKLCGVFGLPGVRYEY